MRIQALILLALLSPTATQAEGNLRYFGYAGIECGWDDPQDDSAKTSYSDEVAGFTNLNMACVDADPAVTAERMQRVAENGATVLLNIQPALFRAEGRDLHPQPEREVLWALVEQGVSASKVPLERIVLYVVDEPSLHGLTAADVSEAAQFLRGKWPDMRLMVVDARLENGPGPIPAELDYWGFFDYFHADPGADADYVAYLDRAAQALHPGQSLVLVMDAMHTPYHAETGLPAESMADIALAYERLALATPKVTALMAYAWAGGIDQGWELGVRDLPPTVRATHESIGRRIIP
jgi:hypothetical protein